MTARFWTPERNARLVYMHDVLKMSFAECGAVLGKGATTCKWRYYRIKDPARLLYEKRRMSAGPVLWQDNPDMRKCLYNDVNGKFCGRLFESSHKGKRHCPKCEEDFNRRAPGAGDGGVMADDMIERLQKAIDEEHDRHPGKGMYLKETRRALARAVVRAMREPTEVMLAAANDIDVQCHEVGQIKAIGRYDDPLRVTWQAMIDAALGEKDDE